MKIWGKANAVAKQFLDSNKMRTYTDKTFSFDPRTFTLEFERDEEDQEWLQVTTWGHCYDGLKIPTTYKELVNLKCRAQLGLCSVPQEIAVRFYMTIMRRVNP